MQDFGTQWSLWCTHAWNICLAIMNQVAFPASELLQLSRPPCDDTEWWLMGLLANGLLHALQCTDLHKSSMTCFFIKWWKFWEILTTCTWNFTGALYTPTIISHNNLIVGFNFAPQHLNWPAVGNDWNGNMWTGAYWCIQISYIDKNLLAHFVFYHLRCIEYFITHRAVLNTAVSYACFAYGTKYFQRIFNQYLSSTHWHKNTWATISNI